MEGRGIEQDYYEFEMLLDEIPNVTSGTPLPEESIPTDSSPVLTGIPLEEGGTKSSVSTTFTNFYHASQGGSPSSNVAFYAGGAFKRSNIARDTSHGSFNPNIQTNGNLDGAKTTVKNDHQSPIKNVVNREDSNLPDDQSLTSAFTQLNFKDGLAIGETSPRLINYKTLPNCTILDSGRTAIPSPRSPNSLNGMTFINPTSNGLEKFNVELSGQELKKQKPGYCQSLENLSVDLGLREQQHNVPEYSGLMPIAPPSMHAFQVLPSIPVPEVDLSIPSYQQQYFFDAQSRVPYMVPQQLRLSHISWQHMEQEQNHIMHQHYLYLQQLRSQLPDTHHPIQANGNGTIGPITSNARQPYFEMPIPQHLEHVNRDPFRNSNASIRRSFNSSELTSIRSSSSCRYYSQGFCGRGESCPFTHEPSSFVRCCTSSDKDFDTFQVLNEVEKNNSPEKILTRSHGLNLLKAINPGPVLADESPNHVITNGKVLSNGHFHHHPSVINSGSFQCLNPDNADFRINSPRPLVQKYNSVDDVVGKIYFMARDQHGCRFLQRKFTEGSAEDIEKIFVEIISHIVELMMDPFGNYLVQKLLEVCNEAQKIQILRIITRKPMDFVRISCDMHGTRAVQKVIETLKTPEQFSMVVLSLKPNIVTLMKDVNGNHVVQRCLQYLKLEYSEFLFEAAIAHCFELATDRHGCCVLQKCLGHSDGEQRRRLVCEITPNALVLSQDQYGNYVVQYVFELQVPWATVDMLDQLDGNYGYLSMQKYSSNVVEKCLKYAGEERCPQIIQELINDSQLDQILQDPYGNYVVQAALTHSKGASHVALVEAIRPHVSALRTSPYGMKVLSSNSLKNSFVGQCC